MFGITNATPMKFSVGGRRGKYLQATTESKAVNATDLLKKKTFQYF